MKQNNNKTSVIFKQRKDCLFPINYSYIEIGKYSTSKKQKRINFYKSSHFYSSPFYKQINPIITYD